MRRDILAVADAFVGVPYRLHGDTPDGWDCLGLLKFGRREWFGKGSPFGPDLYTAEDARDPDRAEALIRQHMGAWREVEPVPGAAILFERMGRCDHVGLLLDARHFIHADVSCNTVTADIRGKWRLRVRGFYDA